MIQMEITDDAPPGGKFFYPENISRRGEVWKFFGIFIDRGYC